MLAARGWNMMVCVGGVIACCRRLVSWQIRTSRKWFRRAQLQRATACKAPQHGWRGRQPRHRGVCNLQNPQNLKESHPLRQLTETREPFGSLPPQYHERINERRATGGNVGSDKTDGQQEERDRPDRQRVE